MEVNKKNIQKRDPERMSENLKKKIKKKKLRQVGKMRGNPV